VDVDSQMVVVIYTCLYSQVVVVMQVKEIKLRQQSWMKQRTQSLAAAADHCSAGL